MLRRHLAELVALPMLPLLLAQGRYVRRVTPRLPEAAGPTSGCTGTGGGEAPLTLLAIGESPVAGVGVADHQQAITGQLALALSARTGRSVRWQAAGRNGITAAEALDQLLPSLPAQAVDIALIAFGVNDTSAFRASTCWSKDLLALWQAVRERCAPDLIILCGVPPVGRFPALPPPLRWVLGLKADALDLVTRELAADLPGTLYVPVVLEPACEHLMASDGYHPSAAGCTAWAEAIADACMAYRGRVPH